MPITSSGDVAGEHPSVNAAATSAILAARRWFMVRSNFGGNGEWIILRIPRLNRGGAGGTAVWELHTNGLKTPGVSIAALPGS